MEPSSSVWECKAKVPKIHPLAVPLHYHGDGVRVRQHQRKVQIPVGVDGIAVHLHDGIPHLGAGSLKSGVLGKAGDLRSGEHVLLAQNNHHQEKAQDDVEDRSGSDH